MPLQMQHGVLDIYWYWRNLSQQWFRFQMPEPKSSRHPARHRLQWVVTGMLQQWLSKLPKIGAQQNHSKLIIVSLSSLSHLKWTKKIQSSPQPRQMGKTSPPEVAAPWHDRPNCGALGARQGTRKKPPVSPTNSFCFGGPQPSEPENPLRCIVASCTVVSRRESPWQGIHDDPSTLQRFWKIHWLIVW